MPKQAYDLLKLMGKLSHQKTKDDAINFFTNNLNRIFPDQHFNWVPDNQQTDKNIIPIETSNRKFGYLLHKNSINIEGLSDVIEVFGLQLEKLDNEDYIRFSKRHSSLDIAQKTISLEELDFYFENMLGLLCIADTDGYFIKLSNDWEATLGYKLEELVGKKFFDFVHPDDLQSTINAVSDLSSQKKVLNFINRYRTKNGTYRVIEWRSNPYGKYIFAAARDITQHKEIEEALRQSESQFRIAFDNAPTGMSIIGATDFQFLAVNPLLCEMFGYSKEEFVNNNIRLITHPDDIERSNEWIRKKFNNEPCEPDFEKRFIHKDGHIVWGLVRAQWIRDEYGKPVMAINHILDITSRKQAEESLLKFQYSFEHAPLAVFWLNRDGKLIYVNNQAVNSLGYTKDEFNNMHLWDIDPVFKKKEWYDDWEKYEINKPGELEFFKSLYKRKDGSSFPVEITARRLNFGKEELQVAFVQDITERKKSELLIKEKNAIIETQNEEYRQLNIALKKAKEHAEESDRLKTVFLQNMSHEIRTPMNAIVGFAELLRSELDEKDASYKYAQIIGQRSNDLLAIINDILDISKIESGLLPVNNEECNIIDLFSELAEFFKEHQKKIHKNNILFSIQLPVNTDETYIITDKVKLKQILINLINNAFKFTIEGMIEAGCKQDAEGKLFFYVSDTGIGISKDQQNYIFERFAQINQNLASSFGGTGLGLPIVKGLLGLLHGKIWLESLEGKGSTFYFSIAYKKYNPVQQVKANTEKSTDYDYSHKTILIVEDDYFNSLFIKEVLTQVGYRIEHTEYGNNAISMAAEKNVDLILMDIRLPDTDGYEATRQILKNDPKMKIIAQTAYASQNDRLRAIEAGCVDYISKPLKKELLIAKINKQLAE